ncbi:MAG: GNAT family N-acetyltransferase [Chloroflexi bacterium]|nr:GNAT family N-acetyltransferase [Chloroflexota bacterium]
MPVAACEVTFETLRDLWESILPSSSFDNCFLTPGLQRIWWDQFGRDAELCLMEVRNDGDLQGIAPLMFRDGTLSFLGDTDLFDYHDFVVLRGKEEGFYPTLMDCLEPRGWHTIELTSIPEGSPTLDHLPRVAGARGYVVEVEQEDVTMGAALPNTWEAYLASLSRKDRHELRRKMRRLSYQVESRQYYLSSPEAVEEGLPDFLRLLRLSGQDKAQFMTEERERFFYSMAVDMASQGRLKLYFLEVNGVRAAAALCFDYGSSLLLYNSGYDTEYASLSVGLLLKVLCLKEAIEAGKKHFNFLRGSEVYKYRLGAVDEVIYTISATR